MLLKSEQPQWFPVLLSGVLTKLWLPSNKHSTVPAKSAAVADIILTANVLWDPVSDLLGFISVDLKKI